MDVEGYQRDVAGGRNEEQVQEAGRESKEGDVLNSEEEVCRELYEGCQ